VDVEVDGAAKAASSARGNRSSTVLLSVANRARADRAWRIEYWHQPCSDGMGWGCTTSISPLGYPSGSVSEVFESALCFLSVLRQEP